ncbi:MAG: hypothetical protein D6734_11655, partial [Candidatus Schekmanbacteria bacterium]
MEVDEIREEREEIIYCRLLGSCRSQKYLTQGVSLRKGDFCIVEGDKGQDAALVSSKPFYADENDEIQSLKKIIRKATDEDLKKIQENKAKEPEILAKAMEKVREKNLQMKIVRIDVAFDNSKIVFYFIADGRIDFRELVKDLAYEFRTRIEMRQIGVRDQARMYSGFGHCGRELCCRSFLEEFEPVTIKMAKAQNLTLNPSKLSGVCGRLMCCLMYEYSTYREINRNLPKYGKKVRTRDGQVGKVRKINTMTKKILIELEDNTFITVDADDVTPEKPP